MNHVLYTVVLYGSVVAGLYGSCVVGLYDSCVIHFSVIWLMCCRVI